MILENVTKPTPLTPLQSRLFNDYQVNVWIKRDDLNHPTVQGNKWHKLQNNLIQAKQLNKDTLITFGGAYSNHIAATAAAAKAAGFKSIGIIRGDELAGLPEKWSNTLKGASTNGMQFIFIDRQTYRKKDTSDYLNNLQQQHPNAFIIPEGGTNQHAILGFENLVDDLYQQCPDWTHVFSAVGTGGTLAGLIHFSQNKTKNRNQKTQKNIIGVPVLKQGEHLKSQINDLLDQVKIDSNSYNSNTVSWQLLTQYHDGGYAKQSPQGLNFQKKFEEQFGILLDPIYTSKMVYAFYDQLKSQKIVKGSNVILLHTGGLQGRKQTYN